MGRRVSSGASTTFASFLPNACTDKFFLANVFADDVDEIYDTPIQPVPRPPNWWHANTEPASQGTSSRSCCSSSPTPSSARSSTVSTAQSTAASSSSRRRRTRRPASTAAVSFVSAVASSAQTVVYTDHPALVSAAERRAGVAGGRAMAPPQGRSLSTPRMRNPDRDDDDTLGYTPLEAPRRRAEDDAELSKLREQAHLKATLRQFQDAFAAEHGRRPQFVRDWKPVWEKYKRYQALRGQLSASTISAESNGIV